MKYVAALGAAALISGCGGSPALVSPSDTSGITQPVAGSTKATRSLRVLHAFGGPYDGQNPQAALVAVDGVLYGTTLNGGDHGLGTVYSISASGSEKVLHNFAGSTDGANPAASLIDVNGTLYGTTVRGGSGTCDTVGGGCGTVYSISTSGSEKVLYNFAGGTDGANPDAPLVDVNGTLYGTTEFGGGTCYGGSAGSCGTVYSISTSGSEKVLHSFAGGYDGALPIAGLLDVKGTLYGTTWLGGRSKQCAGCGTVYRINTNGAEKVLHSFCGDRCSDGEFPTAALIDVSGTLYGTTTEGGSNTSANGGTVFSITTSGKERVLYGFGGERDGFYPTASLLDVKGTLYGTTAFSNNYHGGGGTAFSISTGGAERVLFYFGHGDSGQNPWAGLIDVNGTLYGTTQSHGRYQDGTLFALKP